MATQDQRQNMKPARGPNGTREQPKQTNEMALLETLGGPSHLRHLELNVQTEESPDRILRARLLPVAK